jgi:hypothetical protein
MSVPLKVGDQVNLTVHEGGAIFLTPLRPVVTPEEAPAAGLMPYFPRSERPMGDSGTAGG